MSKICITNDARIPVRASYVSLYKWPESDAEFVKSAAVHGGGRPHSGEAVDSISCRQMYLRSYTFSRKESVPQRTIKCFGKVRERVAAGRKEAAEVLMRRRRRRVVVRRLKELSRAIFRRMLFCTTTVDVAESVV